MDAKLHPDRFFSPNPGQLSIARELYHRVKELPLICPHGHVDPRIFADPDYRFGSPTDLLLVPDHYIFRMLYSQGISLEELGVPRLDGANKEYDPRKAWQLFAENFFLFQGTPTGIWLKDEFANVFGITEKINGGNAQEIYDEIDQKLKSPEFAPRHLFDKFKIEVLCTTDAATDSLEVHQQIRNSDWGGSIRPTFRPDAVVNLATPGWQTNIEKLAEVSETSIHDYSSFIEALKSRREFFKSMGATATDHAAETALTLKLPYDEADTIFQRALHGKASEQDAVIFNAGILVEMARMSLDDGLVMQLHVGSSRNHNPAIFQNFGTDMGADMPITSEFTKNLRPLLDLYGDDPRLTLILFTLDESTYSRELAPLAGHYPAIKLGPPWWFHDSLNGMQRYLDRVVETAGIYNMVGFNDDTRAFPSIPARHDLWRRTACDWIASLQVRKMIDEQEAHEMAHALSYSLAKSTYRL